MSSNNLVSVIINAFNEEKYIESTLKGVRNQTYNNIELIVVDNGSEDKTAEIAKRYDAKVERLVDKGISKAKNYGAFKSKGDLLAFLDSDIEIQQDLIEKSVKKIRKGYVAALCPRKTEGGNFLGDSIFNFIDNYILLGLVVKIPRGFLLTPRKIFEDMHKTYGVFREDLILGEDLHCGEVLKRYGKVAIVDSLTKTSARRQIRDGYPNVAFQWLKTYYNLNIGEKIGKTMKIKY